MNTSAPSETSGAAGEAAVERPAPPLTYRTGDYWRSGAEGVMRVAQCQDCAFYIHPPMPSCPRCHGAHVAFSVVSGRGTVYSYTINRYQWSPGIPPPYVIAEIELAEQPGLKILSTVVGLPVEDVRIGMPVQAVFDQAGDAYIPVFQPEARS